MINKKWLAISVVIMILGSVPIAIFITPFGLSFALRVLIGFAWGAICMALFSKKIIN